MTEKEKDWSATRRNLLLSTATAASIASGGAQSALVGEASAQEEKQVDINVLDAMDISILHQPISVKISLGSSIVVENITSAKEKEPCIVKVQFRVIDKLGGSGKDSGWDTIGRAPFRLDGTGEVIPVNKMTSRSLFSHQNVSKSDFEVKNGGNWERRMVKKEVRNRVVVEGYTSGTLISESEADVETAEMSFGMNHGMGVALGDRLGIKGPEYESGVDWTQLDKVPDDEDTHV